MKKNRQVKCLLAAGVASLLLMTACGAKETQSDSVEWEETADQEEENAEKAAGSAEKAAELEEASEETAAQDEDQKRIEKVLSALGDVPYYGDTSKCQMSVKQAMAYAQLIADGMAGNFSVRGGYSENYNIVSWAMPFQVWDVHGGFWDDADRSHVMLADFAGDGNPYLYLYSTTDQPTENTASVEKNFEIYGWNGKEAELIYPTDVEYEAHSYRQTFQFYEDDEDGGRFKMDFVEYGPPQILYVNTIYVFEDGGIKQTDHWEEEDLPDENCLRTTKGGVEKKIPYDQVEKVQPHKHTLPYTCFHKMSPCAPEDMVNYLNAYASVMSNGESEPIKVSKLIRELKPMGEETANTAETEAAGAVEAWEETGDAAGDGLTIEGDMPQWKVNSLKILKDYMNGQRYLGDGINDVRSYSDSSCWQDELEPNFFYFDFSDINNDGRQELLVTYRRDYYDNGYITNYTEVYLPSLSPEELNAEHGDWEGSMMCIHGANLSENLYLCESNCAYPWIGIYTYDGQSFSIIAELDAGLSRITEDGETWEISLEDADEIYEDWLASYDDFYASTHLDISNIERVLRVTIETQGNDIWMVRNAE